MSYSESDYTEINKLISACSSPLIKKDLEEIALKIKKDLDSKKEEITPKPVAVTESEKVINYTKISDFAWENLSSTVKIYITFKDAASIPNGNISVNFKKESFEVLVNDFNGKNYRFFLRTAKSIVPSESTFKKTSSKIIVVLKKEDDSTWSQIEKK